MSYFVLNQDARFANAVKPLGVMDAVRPEMMSPDHAHQLAAVNLHFKVAEATQVDYVDFIEHPVPFVSDRLKRVLEKFTPDTQFFAGAFTDLKRKHQEIYWLAVPPQIECLSKESEFGLDGSLRRLVIDESRTEGCMFLQIGGLRERILLIHLALAEGLLRRDLNGIRLTRVH
ncbi:serine protease [Paenibacillus jiagnxiensis]|uniref:serine protease n=1 Tax=Paenibacillus jiagnxiensis TaxID=3228926 RepID=UPI0033BE103A